MPDTYPEQLAERMRAQHASGRSVNKAAFLAVKTDVASALAAGFLPKDIWRDLCACQRINFSYDTFLRLVKLHIAPAPAAPRRHAAPESPAAIKNKPNPPAAPASRPAPSPSASTGFVFNPVPNKEELL